MSEPPSAYRPGDIVNGSVLGQDNQWHPLALAPSPQLPEAGSSGVGFLGRHKIVIGAASAVVALAVIAAAIGANARTDDSEAKPSPLSSKVPTSAVPTPTQKVATNGDAQVAWNTLTEAQRAKICASGDSGSVLSSAIVDQSGAAKDQVKVVAEGLILTECPSTSTPSDPFENFEPEAGSSWSIEEQKYLYALTQALNPDAVEIASVPLVIAGTAACAAFDSAPNDATQVDIVLSSTDAFMGEFAIPSEYIAISAASTLCPTHKDFVLATLGSSAG